MGIDPKQERALRDGTASAADEPKQISDEARPRAGKDGLGGQASGHTEGHPESAPNPRPEGRGNQG